MPHHRGPGDCSMPGPTPYLFTKNRVKNPKKLSLGIVSSSKTAEFSVQVSNVYSYCILIIKFTAYINQSHCKRIELSVGYQEGTII